MAYWGSSPSRPLHPQLLLENKLKISTRQREASAASSGGTGASVAGHSMVKTRSLKPNMMLGPHPLLGCSPDLVRGQVLRGY